MNARATKIYSSIIYRSRAVLYARPRLPLLRQLMAKCLHSSGGADSVWHLLAYVLPRSTAQHCREPKPNWIISKQAAVMARRTNPP